MGVKIGGQQDEMVSVDGLLLAGSTGVWDSMVENSLVVDHYVFET